MFTVAATAFKIENVDQMEKMVPKIAEKVHPNTTFVIFGTRHGHKHPDQYLKEHPNPTDNFEDDEKELSPVSYCD